MIYQVVPTNPKTGKIIKNPKRGQKVIFSLLGPRGSLKKLTKLSQTFYAKDLKGLNSQVANTKGGNFVIYEQLTKSKVTKEDIQNKEANRKEIGLYKTKIAGPTPANKQRPVLYVRGRRNRGLDIGFKKGNRVNRSERQIQTIATPGVQGMVPRTTVLQLSGSTIKDAISKLQINLPLKNLKNKILYYNLKMRVYEPLRGGGYKEPGDIPVNGSVKPHQMKYMSNMVIDGKFHRAIRNEIKTISNVKTIISKDIRKSLAEKGYKFTSLVKLKQIQKKETNRIDRLKLEHKKILASITDTKERNDKRVEFDESIKRAWAAYNGIRKVGNEDMFSKIRANGKAFQNLSSKWKVEIYISFELVG